MLKCRHLRVKVKAPKAAVMRMRDLALLLVLPLAMDPIHLLVEMQVLQGAEIKRIGRRRRRGKETMKRGRRMTASPSTREHYEERFKEEIQKGKEVSLLDRQLVC